MSSRTPGEVTDTSAAPQSFDDFTLRLGDVMRGERATLGKSLLDVQRELRIRASYIAAIENCDPSAFDTPGFIAGYVRSYARYLGMDPDDAFTQFCAESGFSVAHGMSERASTIRKASSDPAPARPRARDPLIEPRTPFAAQDASLFSRVEPGAIGSTLVLLALLGGIGFGGFAVLREVQRVQLAPVDQTPLVLSDLDPLDVAMSPSADPARESDGVAGVFNPPTQEWYDRLQRPEALDTPVLVARDGPISTLDPDDSGLYAGLGPRVDETVMPASALAEVPVTQVASDVTVVAVRPAFVRIEDVAGAVLFSGILNGGETFDVPASAVDPSIDVGESGAVYFAVNGTAYGPAGVGGSVTDDIPLVPDRLTARYAVASPEADPALAPVIAQLRDVPGDTSDPVAAAIAALDAPAAGAMPRVTADGPAGVTVVATREVWVRVRAASGATLFETIMQAGDTYRVPQTEAPPTIRAGDAGAVYFAVNGATYGPYGGNGAIADRLALSAQAVSSELAQADLGANSQLARIVAELGTAMR